MKKNNEAAADVKTAVAAADQHADEAPTVRPLSQPPEMLEAAGLFGKPPDKRQTLLEKFHGVLRWLGEVQGGIFIGLGVLYVFGYLNWSYYAWQNNLGVLPVAEAQYLVSGFLNALILGLVLLIVLAARWLISERRRLPAWLFDMRSLAFGQALELKGWRLWARSALIVCFLSALLFMFLFLTVGAIRERFPVASRYLTYASGIIVGVIIWGDILVERSRPGDTSTSALKGFYIYYLQFCVILFALIGAVYAINLYSGIPQQLGGFQPRCVRLDLDRAQASADTLKTLVPAEQLPQADSTVATARPGIVRSNPVQVLFAGGGSTIIRADDGKVYEIEKAVVKATSSCR